MADHTTRDFVLDPADPERLANGKEIHNMTCKNSYCHGSNTTLDERVPEMSDSEIFRQVTTGGDTYMEAQTQLSDDDVRDVILYLRTIYE